MCATVCECVCVCVCVCDRVCATVCVCLQGAFVCLRTVPRDAPWESREAAAAAARALGDVKQTEGGSLAALRRFGRDSLQLQGGPVQERGGAALIVLLQGLLARLLQQRHAPRVAPVGPAARPGCPAAAAAGVVRFVIYCGVVWRWLGRGRGSTDGRPGCVLHGHGRLVEVVPLRRKPRLHLPDHLRMVQGALRSRERRPRSTGCNAAVELRRIPGPQGHCSAAHPALVASCGLDGRIGVWDLSCWAPSVCRSVW